MIVLNNVGMSYESGNTEIPVLRNINLVLPQGRRIAVLGGAGSGKSTLIRLLAGIDDPTQGTIERYASVSFPVGYPGGMKRNLTLRQNLLFACRIYGADPEEVIEFVRGAIGFGEYFDEPMRDLPAPLRPLFAVVRSYAIPFDTYLIDGLLAAGTPENRQKCLAMFEARARERGIIMTVRDVRIARRYCDMGAVIHNQQITLYDHMDDAIYAYETLGVQPSASENVEEVANISTGLEEEE